MILVPAAFSRGDRIQGSAQGWGQVITHLQWLGELLQVRAIPPLDSVAGHRGGQCAELNRSADLRTGATRNNTGPPAQNVCTVGEGSIAVRSTFLWQENQETKLLLTQRLTKSR